MTNHDDSNNPTDTPNSQPGSQPPASAAPPTPGQHEVRHDTNERTHNQDDTARELAREFRWVEFAQLAVNGGLAVIGIFALCIYNGQLNVMRGQLGEVIKQFPEIQKSANAAKSAADTAAATLENMDQNLYLQIRAERLRYGTAKVQVADSSRGVYHEGETGKVWARVWFENVGDHDAESSVVAIKLEFLPLPPIQSERKFLDSEFKKMTPDSPYAGVIRPRSKEKKLRENIVEAPWTYMNRLISREQYHNLGAPGMKVFVWGEIRYKDWTKAWDDPTPFCRFAPSAKAVLDAKEGGALGTGYSTPWEKCD